MREGWGERCAAGWHDPAREAMSGMLVCRVCHRDLEPSVEGHSTRDVAKMLGVSYRQLNMWRTRGWIEGLDRAPGSGTRLRWAPQHIASAAVLARAAALKARSIPEIADELRTREGARA